MDAIDRIHNRFCIADLVKVDTQVIEEMIISSRAFLHPVAAVVKDRTPSDMTAIQSQSTVNGDWDTASFV